MTSICKLCRSELRKPGLQAKRAASVLLRRAGFKQCSECGEIRPAAEFHKRIASPDGLAYKCIQCVNACSQQWRQLHPEAHREWYRNNRNHKSDYFRSWRKTHAETERFRIAQWARQNPGKVNANIGKRNAARLRAIPSWADPRETQRIYDEAAKMRRATGLPYEVDHIVPLQSKRVCGLHWSGNLQIILKAENISKHNRRWPGMPTL